MPWTRAVAARCRGLLAEHGFEDAFEESLAITGDLMPLEHARTQLCLGMRRRRVHRRVAARSALTAALEYFENAGAEPWAEQARAELRTAGAPAAAAGDGSLRTLTPQELQVALSVAQGITNREAAASLFLSEKTVEFHLSNVYRKLGLRSRTELRPARGQCSLNRGRLRAVRAVRGRRARTPRQAICRAYGRGSFDCCRTSRISAEAHLSIVVGRRAWGHKHTERASVTVNGPPMGRAADPVRS